MARPKSGNTQENAVIDYMTRFGSITSMDAFMDLGVTRLAAVIFNIKEHGHKVDTEWEATTNRYGNPVSFVRYSLKDEGKVS